MDNRNGMKININDGNESTRVATEPSNQRATRVATEPSSAHARREAAVPGVPVSPNTPGAKTGKKPKKPLTKQRKISIAALVVGVLVLIGGLVFFLVNFLRADTASDADYLVKIGAWQREDAPSVIWDFTEIGKGQLTTNDHVNDYDFTWALMDDQLKIDTDWLYTLNNEYSYQINQAQNTLTLTSGDETWTFVPADDNADNKSSNKSATDDEIDDTVEESVEDTLAE